MGTITLDNLTSDDIVCNTLSAQSTQIISDRRFKKNIKNILNSLQIISQLNGVTHDWDKDYSKHFNNKKIKNLNLSDKNTFGFIAQDMEK